MYLTNGDRTHQNWSAKRQKIKVKSKDKRKTVLPPLGVAPEHPYKDSSQPSNVAQTKAEKKSSSTTSLLTRQKSTHSTLSTAVRSQTPQPKLKYSTGTNGEVCVGSGGPR